MVLLGRVNLITIVEMVMDGYDCAEKGDGCYGGAGNEKDLEAEGAYV